GPGQVARLACGVTLGEHPNFKANARLSTEPLAVRDLGGITLPRLIWEDPNVCVPLGLSATRGSDPALSVLELTDVADPSVVTPQTPVRLTAELSLQRNEYVLPVAYDGTFFLVLGRVDRRTAAHTSLALDRLPPPLADGRSLTGAIKIFFE